MLTASIAWLALSIGACAGDDEPSSEGSGEGQSAATADPSSEHADLCFDQGKSFEGEARLYIEHNATDKDTGVHGMFDQEGLAAGCLQSPAGDEILVIDPVEKLGELGINQFFFESREPPNNQYSIADLKADFPEGEYRISGIDYEGTKRVATARFTHDIPAPPEITSPKIVGEDEAERNKLSSSGVVVRWQPVSETIDGVPVDISGYEVIVTDDEASDPDNLSQPEYDVHVPPNVTELPVPEEFFEAGRLYEVEVLALEQSGNQTISVGFFTVR